MAHKFEFTDEDSDDFYPKENGLVVEGECPDCGETVTQFFAFIGSRVDEHECPYGEHEIVIQEYEKKSGTKVAVHSECEDCNASLVSYYER